MYHDLSMVRVPKQSKGVVVVVAEKEVIFLRTMNNEWNDDNQSIFPPHHAHS